MCNGGSMSSAIACALDGFEMDIIEIDEIYFKNAIKRFKEATSQTQLFKAEKPEICLEYNQENIPFQRGNGKDKHGQ